jgi:glucokinase
MKKSIGCDLGRTNLRAAIVDVETGKVLQQKSISILARKGHDAVMKRMADLFLQLIQSSGLQKEKIGGKGDEIAKDIYERAGFYLGIAAANVCVAIGPSRIFIGGVAQAGELLLNPIRRTLKARASVMPVDEVEIVPSQLGNKAGVIGVACWAASHS